MKFVKQILVGGLLLTALGQSSYATEVQKESECPLEEQMRSLNTRLIASMPAAFSEAEQKAFESLSTTVKKVVGSVEEQAASFLESSMFKFFSSYTPRSKMKCNTTIVLDVKTSETSGVAYEKISSIAI